MSTQLIDKARPELGSFWLPERSLSLPERAIIPQKRDIFVSVQFRPKWSSEGLIKLPLGLTPPQIQEYLNPFRKDIDPVKFKDEPIWMDIGHNERVDKGGDINITRLFGAVSGASTAAAVLASMAIASASLTVAHGDLSLGSGSANVTTNEFTTIGLSRVTATIQNYVATTTLDATVSVDLFKSFSVSGTGTAYGAGLFDSNTVSGSFLFVEKNFATSASVINGDTLQVTITITL